MHKYSEEKLAKIRQQIKRDSYKKRWKTRRANEKARKVKRPPQHKWSFFECLEAYKPEFNDIMNIIVTTVRSQTKQSHSNPRFEYLSQKILYLNPFINVKDVSIEDIEQELIAIWWLAYSHSRKMGWSLKCNFMSYASFFLPRFLKPYISSVYRTNVDKEISYDLDLVKSFEIDMNYVFYGSDQWPASLFNSQERYLIFLLQEHPNEYTKISEIMKISSDRVLSMTKDIQQRLTKELDLCPRKHKQI